MIRNTCEKCRVLNILETFGAFYLKKGWQVACGINQKMIKRKVNPINCDNKTKRRMEIVTDFFLNRH